MKKRRSIAIIWLAAFLSIMSILFMVKSFSPIKAADEPGNQIKIDVRNETDIDQTTVVLTIENTEKQELMIQTEGIKEIDNKIINNGIDSTFDGKVVVEETENPNRKKVFIENGTKPLVLSFSVEKERTAKLGKINLLGNDQKSLIEKSIDFEEVSTETQSVDSETHDTELSKQSRALTRDATTPPVNDSLPLLDVFRTPIGTGPELINDGKVLRVTQNRGSQIGAIWSKRKLNLKKDFHLKSFLYLGDRGASAGDGMTFTLQNDPRMATSPELVIGSAGMGLGAYYSGRSGNPYIQRGLSIEFDTYFNNGSGDRMDREVGQNGRRGHVAFVTPSLQNNNYTGQHHSWILAQEYLSNGKWRTLDVLWDSVTQTLSYTLSGVGTDSYRITDLNAKFGGTDVYWGFTGSTGGSYEENAIAITQLPGDIEQTAQIENLTQNIAPQETVQARKNDTLKLKDTIKFDGNSIMSTDGTKMRVNLAEGLTYKTDTLALNGEKIPESSIQKNNNQLIISNLSFSRADFPYDLSLEAAVTGNENDVQLKSSFDYLSSVDAVVSTSNAVFVKIPLVKGTVTIHYVDENKVDLASSKTLNQKVGTTYNETPISVTDYLYDRTEGNASGIVQETPQDVYFYYKKAKADLTVQFVDESGGKLHEAVVKEKTIGEKVDLTKEKEVKDAIAEVLTKRYLLENSGHPTNEKAVLINANGTKVTYTFQGTLSIYSGPKEINFGSHEVSWKGTKDANPSYDQPLIIWDNRKTLDNWKLSVKLEDELSIPDSPDHVLNGVLSYQTATDKKTLSVDAQEVLRTKHEASGQYNVSNKTWGPDKQGLRLDVPPGAVKLIGDYETTLIWRVEEAY
ncbi:MucBP domain-containing protein [Enterococcus ureasiticus]|uniref:lectin-like domain-containing protein n=1 Tax=Enterococcus ureasiticus TaxID=903984 RepID=UPI001A8C81B4|nr:MucBP domain-containing protein [Enterococcus ureasiticus]MBO0473362.1 MucBP domain-containing protein [Enterococcus ureasiticus]